jgi:site-specific DNA-methyltransferase (adenine-specific)
MKEMADCSIDFVCTDPPYGLKFMGKSWDHGIPGIEYWQEALRICKPGSMLAAFGGTRTFHRLTCAIEDSGWEIRDCIMWLYGSGFPKSHNKFGLEGFGTALKPAWEPIIICMKPLDGTYAKNVEKWGLGGINIDATRIFGEKKSVPQPCFNSETGKIYQMKTGEGRNGEMSDNSKGRWAANLILNEQAAEMLDQMSGFSKGNGHIRIKKDSSNPIFGKYKAIQSNSFCDSSGASRFFYCAKSSSSERNAGLEGMDLKEKKTMNDFSNNSSFDPSKTQNKCGSPSANNHPTVKPLSLMRYLIKLLAPPNNPTLLDPFMGSGSTLIAAKQLGINAIGIELSEEYCQIARKRLEHWKEFDPELAL